jgi:hypothetical protein
MRFNVAGFKFGHVPLTKLSPGELALRGDASKTTNPGERPRPGVGAGGNGPGGAPPLAQRAPARPNAPGATHFGPTKGSVFLDKAFIGERPAGGGGGAQGITQRPAQAAPTRPDAPGAYRSNPSGRAAIFDKAFIHELPSAGSGGAQGPAPRLAQRGPARTDAPGTSPLTTDHGNPFAAAQPARARLTEPPRAFTSTGTLAHKPAPESKLSLDFLPVEFHRQFKALKLAVTPATLPVFTDRDVAHSPAKLGAGAFNTVYTVKLSTPGGKQLDRVFKPIAATENGWVAAKTGIDLKNPQVAMRNLATLEYAKKLGFDVIPDTQVGLLTVPRLRLGPPRPQLGLVMERAPGKAAGATHPVVLLRADVARETTKMQLLDHLTGQGDRHAGNYHVHIDDQNRAKVTAFDNDQCFGHKAHSPDATRYQNTPERSGFRGTGLPKLIDTEMASAIKKVTPEHLHEMLGDKLSGPEVQAAIKRLEGVKAHIAQLERRGGVVSPQHWDLRFYRREALSPDDSYAMRDLLHAAKFQQGKAPDPKDVELVNQHLQALVRAREP